MNTKTEKPKGACSLMVTLAIAFFTLSVVALLANSGFALYPANYPKRTGKSCQF